LLHSQNKQKNIDVGAFIPNNNCMIFQSPEKKNSIGQVLLLLSVNPFVCKF